MGRKTGSKNKKAVSEAVEEIAKLKTESMKAMQSTEPPAEEPKAELGNTSTGEIKVTPSVNAETYPKQEESIAIPIGSGVSTEALNRFAEDAEKASKSDKLLVDKFLFYKLMSTFVKGHSYTGHAAVAKFGAILGGTTQAENKQKWDECQEYLAKVK